MKDRNIDESPACAHPSDLSFAEVSDPTPANLVIDTGTMSASGDASDGVLDCYNSAANEVTLLAGWNWYAGADASQIGEDQYDFQTTITHEIGHALGLGGGTDPNSPMFESLAAGVANRQPTVADLNIPEPPEGADPQMAAGFADVESGSASTALTPTLSQREREITALTPALSQGEREITTLTPAVAQSESVLGPATSSSAIQAIQFPNGLAERDLLFGSMGAVSDGQDAPIIASLNAANGTANNSSAVAALTNREFPTDQSAIEPELNGWLDASADGTLAKHRQTVSGASTAVLEVGQMSELSHTAHRQHSQAEREGQGAVQDAFFGVFGATNDAETDDPAAGPVTCPVDNGVLIGISAAFLTAVVRQRTDRSEVIAGRKWSHP